MNKIISLLILVLFQVCPLMGEIGCESGTMNYRPGFFGNCFKSNSVEVRGVAFFPSSDRFRDVFGDVGPGVEVEASTTICNRFNAWINFDFFGRDRHHGSCCKNKINMFDFSFGARYIFNTCSCFQPYLGIGPSFSWLNLKNKSCIGGHHTQRKSSVGGVFKAGVYYYFCNNIFADIFVDYVYQPVHFHHRTVNVGGVRTGLGLGLAF